MQGSPKIKSQMFPDGKGQMDNRASCGPVDIGLSNKRIQKQQSKTSNINVGPTAPMTKRMSLADMIASANRLSKNIERKISKPIIKKKSKVNVSDKPINKVPKTMCTETVPRRSVFEVTKMKLLVPLTPEPARRKHQCINENTFTVTFMLSKKDVAVQTVPLLSKTDVSVQTVSLPSFQQQLVETSSTDGYLSQLFSRKTLNKDATYKDIVKKFDKFLRKNMKTTILFKKYMENLSAQRIVAAVFNHNYSKYLLYFSLFSIGAITEYMLNFDWRNLQDIKNSRLLLK